MRNRLRLGHSFTLLLVLFAAACSGTQPEAEAAGDEVVSTTGTVVWLDLEGGFYAIRSDDGGTYEPTNLPSEFERDGLRVRFRALIREDVGSFRMVGPVIQLQSIRRI